MTVYIEESEMHNIDVLAQTIAHLAGKLSLDDPLREPIEVIAGIIIDKTREWQRRYETFLRDTTALATTAASAPLRPSDATARRPCDACDQDG